MKSMIDTMMQSIEDLNRFEILTPNIPDAVAAAIRNYRVELRRAIHQLQQEDKIDELNKMEVIDSGDDYVFVEDNLKNRMFLSDLGVDQKVINDYAYDGNIDISPIAIELGAKHWTGDFFTVNSKECDC